MSRVEESIIEKFGWRKVVAPKPWQPKAIGEELVGYYGGRTLRTGQFGQYQVVLVHVPYKGTFTITGEMLIRLIDTAGIEKTHPVRVVWGGKRTITGGKTQKLFELLVADLDSITEEELPEVTDAPEMV